MSALSSQLRDDNECAIFDPGSIDLGLLRDFPGTLRALADAIDAGQLAVLYQRAEGVGGPRHDSRAHVLVRFVVAADVFTHRKELP